MKNRLVFLGLFCAVICSAYSYMCYECEDAITAEECDRRQKRETCRSLEETCMKAHYKTASGRTEEFRGCSEKSRCENMRRKCERGEKIQQNDLHLDPITKCEVACCDTPSGADEPCNEARTNSVNIMLMTIIIVSLFVFK